MISVSRGDFLVCQNFRKEIFRRNKNCYCYSVMGGNFAEKGNMILFDPV